MNIGSNSPVRVEFQMQLAEAAQNIDRFVRKASMARRSVFLVGNADIAQTIEQSFETYPRFGLRERRASASMGASAEREVFPHLGTSQPELTWRLKLAEISMNRAEQCAPHAQRVHEHETRTRLAIGSILDPHPATVHADVLVDQRQPEPGTVATRSSTRNRTAGEPFEHE